MLKRTMMMGLAISMCWLTSQSTNPALAADKKEPVPSIKEIMKIAYDDEEGLLEVLAVMIKDKNPKWDTISEKSKEWVKVAGHLGQNKPKKGSAESWQQLSKKWLDDAKKLETAVGTKDVKSSQAALKVLETSCKGCHPSHK